MVRRASGKVRLKRVIWILSPAALILILGVSIFLALTTYRLTHPLRTPETVNPSHYLLASVDVSWFAPDGTDISAWWIPARQKSPTIILAPGYGMDRADTLSLAHMLKEKGFSLLIYSQRGSGSNPQGASTLGTREAGDMKSAVDFAISRPEADAARVGIWGVDIGARSALRVALENPGVRCIVADSPFASVTDFLAVKLREEMGFDSSLLSFLCRQAFRLYLQLDRAAISEGLALEGLSDRSILFIQGQNRSEMAELTARLHEKLNPEKEIISLPVSKVRVMSLDDAESYNRHVTNFFVLNLLKPREKP